jgi:hypothetical protein
MRYQWREPVEQDGNHCHPCRSAQSTVTKHGWNVLAECLRDKQVDGRSTRKTPWARFPNTLLHATQERTRQVACGGTGTARRAAPAQVFSIGFDGKETTAPSLPAGSWPPIRSSSQAWDARTRCSIPGRMGNFPRGGLASAVVSVAFAEH